jgi:hypothetical protein
MSSFSDKERRKSYFSFIKEIKKHKRKKKSSDDGM